MGTGWFGRGDRCTAVFTARRNRAPRSDTAGRRTTRRWLDHRRWTAEMLAQIGYVALGAAILSTAVLVGLVVARGRRRAISRFAAPWPAADRKTCRAPAASRGDDHRRDRCRAGRDPSFRRRGSRFPAALHFAGWIAAAGGVDRLHLIGQRVDFAAVIAIEPGAARTHCGTSRSACRSWSGGRRPARWPASRRIMGECKVGGQPAIVHENQDSASTSERLDGGRQR